MRIRTIKPEFWTHEELSALPEATHMLAAALLNYSDDEGYFNAHPGLIRAACCPLREPSVSVQDSLTHLSNVGYIAIGLGNDGKRYGRVIKFDDHQRVNRPTPSKIKAIGIVFDNSVSPQGALPDGSPPERKGTGKGKEQGSDQSSLRSDSSTAAPSTARGTKPDEVNERKALRIAQITDDAIEAFNGCLGKPHGVLPMVAPGVGMSKRRRQVMRCLRVARDICGRLYGNTMITKQFWTDYFAEVDRDDFKAGRRQGGRDHQSWTPSFEYLTREQTMLDAYDRSGAAEEAA